MTVDSGISELPVMDYFACVYFEKQIHDLF